MVPYFMTPSLDNALAIPLVASGGASVLTQFFANAAAWAAVFGPDYAYGNLPQQATLTLILEGTTIQIGPNGTGPNVPVGSSVTVIVFHNANILKLLGIDTPGTVCSAILQW